MFAPNFIFNDNVPLQNPPITCPESEATKNGWNFWVTTFPDSTRILGKNYIWDPVLFFRDSRVFPDPYGAISQLRILTVYCVKKRGVQSL